MISLEQAEFAKAQKKDIKTLLRTNLIDCLQQFSDVKISASICVYAANSMYAEIGFINQENKTDFGSTFTMWFDNDEVRLSVGTAGDYTKNDTYQVARVKLLNNILNNIAAIEDEFTNTKELADIESCDNLINDYFEQEVRLKEEAKQRIIKEIEESIEPNKIYSDAYNKYIIIKVTPKRVYYIKRHEYKENDGTERFYEYEEIMKKTQFVEHIRSEKLTLAD